MRGINRRLDVVERALTPPPTSGFQGPVTDEMRKQALQRIFDNIEAAGGRGAALLERVGERIDAGDDLIEMLFLALALRFPDLYDEIEGTLDGKLVFDNFRPKLRRLIEQERRERARG